MGVIALPQRHLVQPQYAAPIDYAGLGKGAAILLNPGAGLRDIAAQRDWTLSGNAAIRPGARGKNLFFDQGDTSFASLSSPNIAGAAGTLAIFAARIGASDSFGHVWFSTSTGNNKYYHIYNTENQIDWGVGGGSTTFSLIGKIFNTVNTSLIFTTNGTGSAGKTFYFNGVPTGTPDATAPPAFSAGANSLVFGKYWGGTSWNVDADVLIMAYLPGVFWGTAEAQAFHNSRGLALLKAPPRRIYILPAAGGTTYFQSLSGSVTATGALTKQTGKSLSGSSTATGALTKQTGKSLSGSSTPSGALAKLTSKAFAGSLTGTGGLVKKTAKSYAGSLTPSGALSTMILFTAAFAGSITPSGALSKMTQKALAGTSTITGALTKMTGKGLAGSITMAGALNKLTKKAFSGSVTATGALSQSYQVLKSLAGSIKPTGALSTAYSAFVAGVRKLLCLMGVGQ